MHWSLVFLLAASRIAAAPLASRPDTVVDLGYVKYNGTVDTDLNVTSWNGVHYAKSPEGSLRWNPPVDIERGSNYSSDHIIDASQLGFICPQGPPAWLEFPLTSRPTAESEDCLLLNVHKPTNAIGSKLPVMVQIHGGGYTGGDTMTAPGSFLVSRSKNSVIYVEIQYRLGGFGFLNSAEVLQHGVANVGLLDQRAALNWVQRHIAAFGGDPGKVTIIGGSAGGGCVTAQLQIHADDPKPPFRAAIAEYPWWQSFHDEKVVEAQYQSILNTTGSTCIDDLRKLPYDVLKKAVDQSYQDGYKAGLYGYGDFYYGPSVDGRVLKELPSKAFSAGRFSKVPIMIDHGTLEGYVFTNASVSSASALTTDLKTLWPAADEPFLSQLDKLYPVSSFNGTFFDTYPVSAIAPNTTTFGRFLASFAGPQRAADFGTDPYFFKLSQQFGDAFVNCATRTLAAAFQCRGVPVWKLIWNVPGFIHGAATIGWNQPSSPLTSTPQQQAALQAYLLSFVTDLDPNAAKAFKEVERPLWAKYGSDETVLEFGQEGIVSETDPDASDRCDFFFEHGDVIRS